MDLNDLKAIFIAICDSPKYVFGRPKSEIGGNSEDYESGVDTRYEATWCFPGWTVTLNELMNDQPYRDEPGHRIVRINAIGGFDCGRILRGWFDGRDLTRIAAATLVFDNDSHSPHWLEVVFDLISGQLTVYEASDIRADEAGRTLARAYDPVAVVDAFSNWLPPVVDTAALLAPETEIEPTDSETAEAVAQNVT